MGREQLLGLEAAERLPMGACAASQTLGATVEAASDAELEAAIQGLPFDERKRIAVALHVEPPAPPKKYFGGFVVPFWFKEESAIAFRKMEMRPSDIIFSSCGKTGTHFLRQTLMALIHIDADGQPPGDNPDWEKSRDGYVDMYPVELPADPKPPFNHKCFTEHWVGQKDPRLFVTHLPPRCLPETLESTGRLVIIIRNPKDTCTSLYYMFGVPKDGWLGGYNRYTAANTINAFGSFFDYYNAVDAFVDVAKSRVKVMYYEDMLSDGAKQVEELAAFLEIPCPAVKRDAVLANASFGRMKAEKLGAGAMDKNFYRKGEVGDWRRHFLPEQNEEFDKICAERLAGCRLAAPYLPGGRLADCMSGDGTKTPCWLEYDHAEQVMRREQADKSKA